MIALKDCPVDDNGIYYYDFHNEDQQEEIALRENVATQSYDNYLKVIGMHHSIRVMDREVDRFLDQIPQNGHIIDVGGCWGWHWRNIHKRPDVKVIIVDFVKSNLFNARELLQGKIGSQVFLLHGDATNLNVLDESFDGYWSVQTLQHIPDYAQCIREAYRLLKPNGVFANYSLNVERAIKFLYKVLGKKYHVKGKIDGAFYLSYADAEQKATVESVFNNRVMERYTEIIFHPNLRLGFCGSESSIVGLLDSCLGSSFALWSWIARQRSYHTFKKA